MELRVVNYTFQLLSERRALGHCSSQPPWRALQGIISRKAAEFHPLRPAPRGAGSKLNCLIKLAKSFHSPCMWEKKCQRFFSLSQENRSQLKGNTLLGKTTVILLVSKRITHIIKVKAYFSDNL